MIQVFLGKYGINHVGEALSFQFAIFASENPRPPSKKWIQSVWHKYNPNYFEGPCQLPGHGEFYKSLMETPLALAQAGSH